MSRRDLSNRDFSRHASGELEYVINKQAGLAAEKVPTTTAQEAMSEDRVVEYESSRDVTRVLFISQDTELLNPVRQTLDGYLNISDVFDEVHILVMRKGLQPKQPILRPHDNVFIYTVAAKRWWHLPAVGFEMLRSQLEFAEGFRPDVVVAHDPYESALVALQVRRQYGTATQLHVLVKNFAPRILDITVPRVWRRFISLYTISRFSSVRAATQMISDKLAEKYEPTDLQVLPSLNPYSTVISTPTKLRLETKYPEYVFFLLFVGSLDEPEAALQAIEVAKDLLQSNEKMALILYGDGTGREECLSRAKALGVEKQIIIKKHSTDQIQYLKAANVLLVTNTDRESERSVLRGAAAAIPMVMAKTDTREDLFKNQESALIVESADTSTFIKQTSQLVENAELRKQLSEQALQVVQQKLFQDSDEYRRSYRRSIEESLFVEEE